MTEPTRMIVISSVSLTFGFDDGVNGASPTPGTVSSTNCPASKVRGSFGRKRYVVMVGVSFLMCSMTLSIGL